MDFSISERQKHWRDRVIAFMDAHVYPAVGTFAAQSNEGERWKVIPIVEDLKKKAKTLGIWNVLLPNHHTTGAVGFSNLEYGLMAEHLGKSITASEVRARSFNLPRVALVNPFTGL